MTIAANKEKYFTKHLLKWFATQHRPMPWKGIKNPYFIWLSEIILQQTRVEQGLPYYEHFIKKYPTVFALAKATEDEVMKSWEGLGYYSRARNLHAAAKQIVRDRNGVFPDTYDNIRLLKGVGPYTAAAIASFAFNLPYAVVDGNVYRVLSRFFGIANSIDSTSGKKAFASLAENLLKRDQPAIYNQALMDFGATQCTPKNPDCQTCPFQKECTAFAEDRITDFPVKTKKLKKRARYFNYMVVSSKEHILLNKRTEKDIWNNLYDFPMVESDLLLEKSELQLLAYKNKLLPKTAVFKGVSKPFQQVLSHQKINARFWEYEIADAEFYKKSRLLFVQRNKLSKFAVPKIIERYLSTPNNNLLTFDF